MSAISGFINTIRNAVYGEQVRGAIISALEACYSDVESPSLNQAAFTAAIEAAYAGGILDIVTVTQISAMTNQNIIYRYNGTEAGKQKGLYYYSALSSSWVLIGSEIHSVSLMSRMTDTNSLYKYTGTETGKQKGIYYHNGTDWILIATGGSIDDLKSDFSFTSQYDRWEIGSMNGDDGTVPLEIRTDRIRTPENIPAFSQATIEEGYKFAILAYNGSQYVGMHTPNGYVKNATFHWYTGTVNIELNSNYTFRIVVAKSDGSDMASDDGNKIEFIFYVPSVVSSSFSTLFPPVEGNAEQECVDAFVSKMNEKAALIGMTNSTFANPSGMYPTNTSTAKDMVRLGIACCGNDKICRVWNKKSYTVTTKNETPKDVVLTSTVQNQELDNYYYVFGGKTGAIPANNAYALVAACEVEGKIVVGAVGKANGDANRFTAMKQLMDIAKTIINGGTNSATVTAASYAACAVLPNYNPNLYEQYPLEFLYSQGGDTEYICASNTKCLSMLVMLELCPDINQTIKFIYSDAIGGTGAVFATGDIITYEDALYAAMLPSSNMAVQAVARTLGQKILSNKL